MSILNRGYWVTTLLSVLGLAFVTNQMMQTTGGTPTACRSGSGSSSPASSASPRASRSCTSPSSTRRAPTGRSARSRRRAKTGPATNIISGTAVGFETTARHGDHDQHRAVRQPLARHRRRTCSTPTGVNVGGIFGTAVATMGMLMTTAYILAMDTFGPITDNAGGIAEFSRAEAGRPRDHRPPRRRGQHDQGPDQGLRDRLGVAGRVPPVLRLHRQDQQIIGNQIKAGDTEAELLNSVNLADVNVFVAAFSARCSCTTSAASPSARWARTAQSIIVEVRRQFREMPGIMDYTQRPDYARVVDITTRAALREMVAPGLARGRDADRRRRHPRLPRPWPAS